MRFSTKRSLILKLALLLAFVCCFNTSSYAQTTDTEENDSISNNDITRQLWVHFSPSWKINDRVRLNADLSYRTISPNDWTRLTSRAEISYSLNDIELNNFNFSHSLIQGVGYFYIHNYDIDDVFEYRIYQGYKIGFNVTNRVNIQQYLRLEERFTNLFRKDTRSFGLRFRYKISAVLDLQSLFTSKHRGFYVPADIEFFLNIKSSKQINDIIRVSPGLGYVIDPSFKVQFNLSYHYTKQEFDDSIKTNDIVFRIKVYKTFPFRKVKSPNEL
ncbi:DUF2490 domain-containing protein [Joostella sp.]|uniref:DUF2490 domain-containing protein n=1 Tax=Joostella sp. TaxID=2231138 RepID=UPI003A91B185